ncbi:translation initiation factor IF-2 subunit gamma [Nanoarchaeota archaeon]
MPKKAENTEKTEEEQKPEEEPKKDKEKASKASKKGPVDAIEKEQPELNIGLIGHVDHGKTTLTERLSGKWTDTHSEELKRGITIRLGYADSIFYKVTDEKGDVSYTAQKPMITKGKVEAVRKVSFVDAPGHESLMATMLAGATIMDGALLLIAASEECPQPQTREHLMALEIIGIDKIIIVQNKIDLVSEEQALSNYNQIKEFIKGTKFENSPIIPISAQHNINVDLLIQTMEEYMPTPERDPNKDPLMLVARSFDINKPGSFPKDLVGGVLGGALIQGVLKEGDEIEIKPGQRIEKEGRVNYQPIITKITSIRTGGSVVNDVKPGGSIGVLTNLDPAVVKSDSLTGSVVGKKGKTPPTWNTLNLKINLLERVVGVKDDISVDPIAKGEVLMLNVNSAATIGMVTDVSKKGTICNLKLPVCADIGARVTISRRLGNRFRLIGYGIIQE